MDSAGQFSRTPVSEAAAYRLKRRSLIDGLFSRKNLSRKTIARGSVAVTFDFVERDALVPDVVYQAGVTTNRRIRRAVDRNQVKRLLRETIRRHHVALQRLDIPSNRILLFMLIFRGNAQDLDCRVASNSVLEEMIDSLKLTSANPDGTSDS